MKNWKTTLIGIGGAIALGTVSMVQTGKISLNDWVIMAITAALGFFAKDKNVTGGTVQQ